MSADNPTMSNSATQSASGSSNIEVTPTGTVLGKQAETVGPTIVDGATSAKYEVVAKNFNISELNRELFALKKMGCEAKKQAELEKHKKPHIKRSIGFVIDMSNGLEDIELNANKIIDSIQSQTSVEIDWLTNLLKDISEVKDSIKSELLIHKIASSSIGGYRTVKYFETPEVFKDLDLEDSEKEKLATKLRAAEFKAKQDYNKFKATKNKPTGAIMKPNEFASNSHSSKLLQRLCFKCQLPGHERKNCPQK